MKQIVLYEKARTIKYKSSRCSSAYICKVIFVLLAPLLIAFFTQGLWKKYGEYGEQPDLYFKSRFLMILRGATETEYYVWSTYSVVNQAENTHLKVPVTEVLARDLNEDYIPDQLSITARFSLNDNETITGIFWIFLFDLKLQQRSRISVETALVSQDQSFSAASGLTVTGNLYLDQLIPLPSYGTFVQVDGPIVNESRSDLAHYAPSEIQMRCVSRNFTTRLKRKVETWSPKSLQQRSFTFRLDVKIPEQKLFYTTGLLELLKWAWMQYFCIAYVVHFIVKRIFGFFIENQILPTVLLNKKVD